MPSCQPTSVPSCQPSSRPTTTPTLTYWPTSHPSPNPTPFPTYKPTIGGGIPFTDRPTAYYETISLTGEAALYPDSEVACNPVQIHMSFTFNQNVSGGSFTVAAPGMTSGPCYNATNGYDIPDVLILNSDDFNVEYFEGTYEDNFAGSNFVFTIGTSGITPGQTYVVEIDRYNGIRRSCSMNMSWAVTLNPTNQRTAGIIGSLSLQETYPKKCFVFYSEMYFENGLQQFYTGVKLTLMLGYEINTGTVITIELPGFTNSVGAYGMNVLVENSTDTEAVKAGYDTTLYNITSNTNFTWSARWSEGSYADNFADSKIVLTSYGYQSYNSLFWINIPKSRNHLFPICGHAWNDETFKISAQSDFFYVNTTSFQNTSAIGPGCGDLNKCSGNGVCDYCTSRCTCNEGYGSPEDIQRSNGGGFLPDCSAKACPSGISISGITGTYVVDSVIDTNPHRPMECSNMGICNRALGTCSCFPGFEGEACQKMKCGGSPTCSGRGQCFPMSRLAKKATALPLSTKSVTYLSTNASKFSSTWDAAMGHTCICDSSWSVGLKSGETQLAEYFGPTCEKRRCPSGDNPNTRDVDETDCEGLIQTGNDAEINEPGQAGNKCHIDCSNLGVCDYSVGVCKCFSGYMGENCGTRVVV
jgi:hypothetical protein